MVICTTCSVRVADENKAVHFKSDWHVYNLKRVVASLPPITEDVYESKKVSFKNDDDAAIEKKTYCQACKRSFLNNKSFEAHLTSGKHIKNIKLQDMIKRPRPNSRDSLPVSQPEDDSPSPVHSDEIEPPEQALPLGSCLFCEKRLLISDTNTVGPDQQRSLAIRTLAHMTDAHKFSLPYPDRLVDPAGLLLALGVIVGKERACLYCGRQFYGRRFLSTSNSSASSNAKVSLMAVRSHMLHKDGHLRLWCGTEDPVEMALALNMTEEGEEDEMCSDDEAYVSPKAALAGGELFSQYYDQSVVAPSFVMPPDVGDDAYEIRLPSGTVITHRTMQTVYRQHLGNSLALVEQQSATGRRNRNALPTVVVVSGERQCLQPYQHHHSALLVAPRPVAQVSRANERRREAWSKRWDLLVGLQGNLVNRMHIRRQY